VRVGGAVAIIRRPIMHIPCVGRGHRQSLTEERAPTRTTRDRLQERWAACSRGHGNLEHRWAG
jgi:hypothetical protein